MFEVYIWYILRKLTKKKNVLICIGMSSIFLTLFKNKTIQLILFYCNLYRYRKFILLSLN